MALRLFQRPPADPSAVDKNKPTLSARFVSAGIHSSMLPPCSVHSRDATGPSIRHAAAHSHRRLPVGVVAILLVRLMLQCRLGQLFRPFEVVISIDIQFVGDRRASIEFFILLVTSGELTADQIPG
jgi:hypothetical protein